MKTFTEKNILTSIKNITIKKHIMFIALIIISIFFQISTNGILLVPMNISKLIMQNSYILILAVGMLPCILTGDIDLSVGSIVAIVGAITGTMLVTYELPVFFAVIAGLMAGVLIGAWHGYWIAYVKVPAFIVTLAGMLIFRGLTMVILDGNTLGPFPKSYQYVAQAFLPDVNVGISHLSTLIVGILVSIAVVFSGVRSRKQKEQYGLEVLGNVLFILKNISMVSIIYFFSYWLTKFNGLPIILVLLGVITVVYSFVTTKTIFGRHIYALGGNEKVAALSGIRTKRVKFLVYVNMGFLAAIAGIVFSGRLNSAGPTAGNGFELDAIAACYIGGASASGGVGTVVGVIVGGLVMGVLNNGMSIMGIGVDWQQTIKGLVLLAAVAFDVHNQSKK